jgi:hypothetical protein
MSRNLKHTTVLSIILLAAAMLTALCMTFTASAQSDVATVVVLPSVGGTTNPVAGTYEYANGTIIQLSATPDAGYAFHYWIVSGDVTPGHQPGRTNMVIDPETGEIIANFTLPPALTAIDSLIIDTNSINITCGYGYTYTYQAVFTAPTDIPPTAQNATVIIMPTTGGTVTPAPGMYSYPEFTVITFSATPSSGYEFKYWIATGNFTEGHTPPTYTYITDDNGTVIAQIPKPNISGIDSVTFTANPATVTCGYGYTYTYTAIFAPVAATPTPAPTTAPPTVAPTVAPTTAAPTASPAPADMTSTYIIVAVVVVIIIIVAIAAMMMRRKK